MRTNKQQSARNVSDMHKTIAETLATIPDVMEHAGTYVRIYGSHRSLSLNRKTVDLCKAILVTLRLVIEYIMQGSLSGFSYPCCSSRT